LNRNTLSYFLIEERVLILKNYISQALFNEKSVAPEVVMPYGNYYIVELVHREQEPDSGLFLFRSLI